MGQVKYTTIMFLFTSKISIALIPPIVFPGALGREGQGYNEKKRSHAIRILVGEIWVVKKQPSDYSFIKLIAISKYC